MRGGEWWGQGSRGRERRRLSLIPPKQSHSRSFRTRKWWNPCLPLWSYFNSFHIFLVKKKLVWYISAISFPLLLFPSLFLLYLSFCSTGWQRGRQRPQGLRIIRKDICISQSDNLFLSRLKRMKSFLNTWFHSWPQRMINELILHCREIAPHWLKKGRRHFNSSSFGQIKKKMLP